MLQHRLSLEFVVLQGGLSEALDQFILSRSNKAKINLQIQVYQTHQEMAMRLRTSSKNLMQTSHDNI